LAKLISILVSLIFTLGLNAQVKRPQNYKELDNKRIHFGFTVGVNTMDMSVGRNLQDSIWPDLTILEPGFQVTIVSDLRLSDDFNLRFLPGIAFGQRNISFYDVSTSENELIKEINVPSSYLEFPLTLKYRSKRVNNYRPYLIGGANYRYDMAARKEYSVDDDILIRFQPGNIYLEAGFGIDFYLPFFKLAPEIKVGMGLFNTRTTNPANYDVYFEHLRSYIVMLNFHFE
jgi:hypothetical protein